MTPTKSFYKAYKNIFLVGLYIVLVFPLGVLKWKKRFSSWTISNKSGWVSCNAANCQESIYAEGNYVASLEKILSGNSPIKMFYFIKNTQFNADKFLYGIIYWIIRSEFSEFSSQDLQELPDNQYTLF
jgi:hypothetical protein